MNYYQTTRTLQASLAAYDDIYSRLDRGSLMVERYALQPIWAVATHPATRTLAAMIPTLSLALWYSLLAGVDALVEHYLHTEPQDAPDQPQDATEQAKQPEDTRYSQMTLKELRRATVEKVGTKLSDGRRVSQLGKGACMAILESSGE